MHVTHKLRMDLTRPGYPPVVEAMEGDKLARKLCLQLMADGADWPVPDDVSVLITYRKPDGKGGQYDTLPDGSSAYRIQGSTVTISLAPQVLNVAGRVQLSVRLLQGQQELSTFLILLHVRDLPEGSGDSQDYYSIQGFLPQPEEPAQPGQLLAVSRVDDQGKVLETAAVSSGAGTGGADGLTPHIGSNGHWFLGTVDTGVPAQGDPGQDGQDGTDGQDGKSAYTLAQEAGYTGTEAELAQKLASGAYFLTTYTDNGDGTYSADHTHAEQVAARNAGQVLIAKLRLLYFQYVGNRESTNIGANQNRIEYENIKSADNTLTVCNITHRKADSILYTETPFASGSSGLDSAFMLVTYTNGDNGTFTADHTYEEIVEAFSSGVMPIANIGPYVLTMAAVVGMDGSDGLTFVASASYDGALISVMVTHKTDDSIDVHNEEFRVPEITVDTELSDTSENPVQNKVITAEINGYVEAIVATFKPKDLAVSFSDNTADHTYAEIAEALNMGCTVYAMVDSLRLPLFAFNSSSADFAATFAAGDAFVTYVVQITDSNTVTCNTIETSIPKVDTDISQTSTNPVQNKAVFEALDSFQVNVGIALNEKTTEAQVNTLIDAKLGVIENGAY